MTQLSLELNEQDILIWAQRLPTRRTKNSVKTLSNGKLSYRISCDACAKATRCFAGDTSISRSMPNTEACGVYNARGTTKWSYP